MDDDDGIRSLLAAWLTQAGYHCTSARTFEEAAGALDAGQVDLLITDIRLGEHNGLQLVIRNGGQIPAIVMTGFDDPVLASEVRAQGATYLLKPFRLQELLDQVTSALHAPPRGRLGG